MADKKIEVPQHVTNWVNRNWTRPRVDPDWLALCYEWLVQEGHDPHKHFKSFQESITEQILGSSLQDSMLPGTGLTSQASQRDSSSALAGDAVLVEVTSMTDIGQSAFDLNQTRIAREEWTKDQTVYNTGEEDDGGRMPKYTRGMLKFELSDGTTVLPAIEYRSLPELSLEHTPLGYKMMLLKDIKIHRGTVFLEPKSVMLLGGRTADRDKYRDTDFARGLRVRMGLPEPEPEAENYQVPPLNSTIEVPPQEQLPQSPIRSPLREISPPPSPIAQHPNDDEYLETRRRRIPNRPQEASPPAPSFSTLMTSTLASSSSGTRSQQMTSSYFSSILATKSQSSNTLINLSLSPTRATSRTILTEKDIPTPPIPPMDSPPAFSNPEEDFFGASQRENWFPLSQYTPVTAESSSRDKGKSRRRSPPNHAVQDGGYSSDDFGVDDIYAQVDPAVLEAVEKEAYATGRISSGSQPKPPPPSQARVPEFLSFMDDAPRPVSVKSCSPGRDPEVIVIEDDDDDDKKENFPVPTRHVRRRIDTNIASGSGTRTRPPPASQRMRNPDRPTILAKTASAYIDLC